MLRSGLLGCWPAVLGDLLHIAPTATTTARQTNTDATAATTPAAGTLQPAHDPAYPLDGVS